MTFARRTRLLALWLFCSGVALALFVGVQMAGDRLLMASKMEQIGVWGIYVGLALQTLAAVMLTPLTAFRSMRMLVLPAWMDLALGLTIIGGWGVLGVVVLGRLKPQSSHK